MRILKFTPILKQTLWGGNKIKQLKNLDIPLENIGESWELSGVAGDETLCADESNMSINQLVEFYKERLVGRHVYEVYGNTFPLLVKFIDARQDLSIQVHPDDETARRQNKECGKTEMWYLMTSDEEASIYSGLSKEITQEKYKEMVNEGTICEALCRYSVKEDDVFFLPAGRVHAIGAGCFLAEIQQTSDVTYRIYDFKRKDKDGNYRQLHTEEAAEAIDFRVYPDYRTNYEFRANKAVSLVDCHYFTTSVYSIDYPIAIDQAAFDSFVILIGLKGIGEVRTDDDLGTLKEGETMLIAAENKQITLSGNMKFLEVHIR
ncbi:MAG: class I mannose-6-phosphate isomerase [Prevotellaceae bacterium]|nr:class I mannose-6-phosphate isomerase [Prevotellaceae bacterium]